MQFQVPQFIETEDRIIGPLTLKQFLFIAAGAALSFALFFFLEVLYWLPLAGIIMAISAALAFIQINGRPLPLMVFAALGYYWKPRFYVWQRKEKVIKMPKLEGNRPSLAAGARSMLNNLMTQMNTSKNPIPEREKTIAPSILDRTKSSKERFEMIRKITGDKEAARRIDYR